MSRSKAAKEIPKAPINGWIATPKILHAANRPYRRCHALFGDMARTSQRHSISELEARYEHVFNDYCHVREEAHTVPQWCFSRAEAAILRGDYTVNTLQKGAKDE